MEAPGHVRSCDTPKNDEDPLVKGVFAMERTTGAVGPPPAALLPNPDNTPFQCERPRAGAQGLS